MALGEALRQTDHPVAGEIGSREKM